MSSATILSVLTRPNPDLRAWSIKTGPNTVNRQYLEVSSWKPWTEFNFNTLRHLFGHFLDSPWEDPPVPTRWSSTLDVTYGDEDGLEHQILSRELIPIVNAALFEARKYIDSLGLLHLGRRGRCPYGDDNRLNPDWVLVRDQDFTGDKFSSIVPGETKLGAKWSPKLYPIKKTQWRGPVQQLLSYSNDVSSRYGFIITDEGLTVFRFAYEDIRPGIALTRDARNVQVHQRVQSGGTDLSSSLQDMSISARTSSYVEFGGGREYQDPEYQFIPWENHGEGRLTIKLALVSLCLMAGIGARDIRSQYPKLNNTWRRLDDGGFMHNTLGLTKATLGSEDVLEDSTPESN